MPRSVGLFGNTAPTAVVTNGTLEVPLGPLTNVNAVSASVGHTTTGQAGTLQWFASVDGTTYVAVSATVATDIALGGNSTLPVSARYLKARWTNGAVGATAGTILFAAATD